MFGDLFTPSVDAASVHAIVGVMRPLPLFLRYPELEPHLPFVSFGDYPTPLDHVSGTGVPAALWVKRDDLSGVDYGGNKVRKLEFILAAARDRGVTRLITAGGIGSNHLLATGIFAKKLGISVTGVVVRQPMNDYVRRNLRAYAAVGISCVLARYATLPLHAAQQYLASKAAGERPAWISMGGSTPLGTLGFVNGAFELQAQLMAAGLPDPQRIYVPVGSGGTAAGLALGIALAGLKSEVVGVIVAPGGFASRALIQMGIRRSHALLRRHLPALPSLSQCDIRLSLLQDFIGRGYGYPTEAGIAATELADREFGIQTDWTYSGKTLAALLACERERGKGSGPVLFWHTYSAADLTPLLTAEPESPLPANILALMDAGEAPGRPHDG